MDTSQYTLGEPAEDVYAILSRDRQMVIDQGRTMAELTIPSLFPPQGYKTGQDLPGNNQSVGAHCVNTLSSALLFMAFPPGRPILKYEPIEHKLTAAMQQDPEFWSKIEYALSRLELEHRQRANTTQLPTAYGAACKVLLVVGNVLWKHINIETPTYHLPDCYVVKRDAAGQQLVVIHKECTSIVDLDEDVRATVLRKTPSLAKGKPWEVTADIYSVCKLKNEGGEKSWLYWQEYKGELLPDTEVECDFKAPPLYAAWLIPVYGQNWGPSYCEAYRGDLYTVENDSSALNDAASILSLMLLFVRPGARTTVKQVKEAENLAVLSGEAKDVTALELNKQGDLTVVSNVLEAAIRRLGIAFLQQFSIQRQAERVTAEEWQRMGSELDKAMGGLYTQISQSFQRSVINRFLALHEEEDHDLPELPAGLVRAEPVTGVDAIGQNSETQSLVSFGQTLTGIFGPQVAATLVDAVDFSRRLATSMGIQTRGLTKDQQQVSQDQANAQNDLAKQTLLKQAAGPIAGAAAKGMIANTNTNQEPTHG